MSRAGREKGIRFERRIVRKFKDAGVLARRNLEYDGFNTGADILLWVFLPSFLGRPRWIPLPVAVQCKATKKPSSLQQGLRQCQAEQTGARLHVCVHSLTVPGKRPQLRVAAQFPGEGALHLTSWDGLLKLMGRINPTRTDWTEVLEDGRKQLAEHGEPAP